MPAPRQSKQTPPHSSSTSLWQPSRPAISLSRRPKRSASLRVSAPTAAPTTPRVGLIVVLDDFSARSVATAVSACALVAEQTSAQHRPSSTALSDVTALSFVQPHPRRTLAQARQHHHRRGRQQPRIHSLPRLFHAHRRLCPAVSSTLPSTLRCVFGILQSSTPDAAESEKEPLLIPPVAAQSSGRRHVRVSTQALQTAPS